MENEFARKTKKLRISFVFFSSLLLYLTSTYRETKKNFFCSSLRTPFESRMLSSSLLLLLLLLLLVLAAVRKIKPKNKAADRWSVSVFLYFYRDFFAKHANGLASNRTYTRAHMRASVLMGFWVCEWVSEWAERTVFVSHHENIQNDHNDDDEW